MDNVDVNAELDEPVPAGAFPVTSPEWYRWKFFRANRTMLHNQRAHIENPYAVGETWTQDQSTSVWRFNGNTVRPYGSMYQNETTPDGYYVDANGVRQ